MAVKSCRNCGAEVAAAENSCTRCGARVPHPAWRPKVWQVLALAVGAIGAGLLIGIATDSPPAAPAVAAPQVPAAVNAEPPVPAAPKVVGGTDAESQQARRKIIAGLVEAGVFYKLERGQALHHPMLWVGPAFANLPFDDKRNFVGVVMDYCVLENRKHDAIGLIDWRNGKVIGRMSPEFGLSLE